MNIKQIFRQGFDKFVETERSHISMLQELSVHLAKAKGTIKMYCSKVESMEKKLMGHQKCTEQLEKQGIQLKEQLEKTDRELKYATSGIMLSSVVPALTCAWTE
eukprot:scaffold916_cov516-Prasinococcus_capsulatus_cf.AAC.6